MKVKIPIQLTVRPISEELDAFATAVLGDSKAINNWS